MKITRNFFISLFSGVLIALSAIGCSDHESYSDGLNKETKSINAFLADQRVVGSVMPIQCLRWVRTLLIIVWTRTARCICRLSIAVT